MTRSERRRIEREVRKEAKKRPAERLDFLPGLQEPDLVKMTPARIATMKREIADDLIRMCGDKAAIEQARLDGYNEGREAGEKFAQQHYLVLTYVCMGLAMCEMYGFKAKRISKIWHKADAIYAEMLEMLDDDIPLEDVEEIFNKRLTDETGLVFGLTHSTDELRKGKADGAE